MRMSEILSYDFFSEQQSEQRTKKFRQSETTNSHRHPPFLGIITLYVL